MKILIVSDTHRRNENLYEVVERIGKIDVLIHCGDTECPSELIEEIAGCHTIIVRGNNDFFSMMDKERVVNISKYKVMIVHGHTYNVSLGVDMLVDEAMSRGANIVMYGHTHRPHLEIRDDIIILNPGSLSYPRQEGRIPTYAIMEIDDEGEAHFSICNV